MRKRASHRSSPFLGSSVKRMVQKQALGHNFLHIDHRSFGKLKAAASLALVTGMACRIEFCDIARGEPTSMLKAAWLRQHPLQWAMVARGGNPRLRNTTIATAAPTFVSKWGPSCAIHAVDLAATVFNQQVVPPSRWMFRRSQYFGLVHSLSDRGTIPHEVAV